MGSNRRQQTSNSSGLFYSCATFLWAYNVARVLSRITLRDEIYTRVSFSRWELFSHFTDKSFHAFNTAEPCIYGSEVKKSYSQIKRFTRRQLVKFYSCETTFQGYVLLLCLQRNDISLAISKFDQFDFLIDIVPRDVETAKPAKRVCSSVNSSFYCHC